MGKRKKKKKPNRLGPPQVQITRFCVLHPISVWYCCSSALLHSRFSVPGPYFFPSPSKWAVPSCTNHTAKMSFPWHLWLLPYPLQIQLLAILHPESFILLASSFTGLLSSSSCLKAKKNIEIKNIPKLVLYLITLITKNRTRTFSFLPLATPNILFTPFTGIAFSKNCTKSPPKMDVYLSLLFLKSLCLATWQPSPSKPLCHIFKERCLSKLQRKPIEADSICSPK